ncbi:pseudouridine synthase [Arthrobacter agilis]|uniref:pseudouridine synthase n=1 Tax=Arthrobacter agilis TaxID=37921 RepID=UPI000B363ACC|nr:pseudouridine synthase [Arthrobacter agilis]OUM45365.1 pseudouridine synthase [Arthrobacter agilis]PPB47006.1 pseudouridine synthase [Arthrobacter agilis]TPV23397.1 pseudouridine synthase [Arthrobacter agilis]VDR31775.1 Ribosomal large subunit pseudouridine synthase B [Arthrobacter agilis]
MTQQPGSGSGRNTPRRGGSSGRPSDADRRSSSPRSGSGQGGRAGGRSASGEGRSFPSRDDRGGRSGEGRAQGGERRESADGRARSAAGRPSAGTPSSRFGAKAGRAGKPGRPGQDGGPRQKPAGAKAFGKERFGQNLGPVRTARPKRSARPADEIDVHNPEGVRLQKVMALAGVASRRVCEEMILDGRVEVDGTVVTELGVRVDPEQVAIHVDGIRLQLNEHLKYYVFNKPRGVVSTMEDPEGRRCISDFLKNKDKSERLFHVGRLDAETEGLLLLTNDGELTNRLTHPSYEVPKTYLVQVRGPMAQGIGAQMKEGIELEDGLAKVDSFKLVDSTPGHILVEVVLHSGRNRVVRRLFDAVGHPVERLVRTQVGPIRVGDQRQGSIRVLGRQEVGHLLASVGL